MTEPREVVFHQSANRPTLLLGGDREMVLCAIAIAALIAFALLSLWGFILAIVFWVIAVAILSRMGKADPLLRQVYLTHIRYQSYYPAQSHRRSSTAFIPPKWR